MTHSILKRHSFSSFRRNSNLKSEEKIKKRSSLQLTPETSHDQSKPLRVRQRLSSILRIPTRESIPEEKEVEILSNHSTVSLSGSSDNSIQQPDSPKDLSRDIMDPKFWENAQSESFTFIDHPTTKLPSLAYQVHEILGSTIEEVDDEIDQDWESSRDRLRYSLVHYPEVPTLVL